jgi:hypothetical protein
MEPISDVGGVEYSLMVLCSINLLTIESSQYVKL